MGLGSLLSTNNTIVLSKVHSILIVMSSVVAEAREADKEKYVEDVAKIFIDINPLTTTIPHLRSPFPDL